MKVKELLKTAVLSAALLLTGPALAGAGSPELPPDAPAAPATPQAPDKVAGSEAMTLSDAKKPLYAAETEPVTKKISGTLNVTVPTKYISRGLILNKDRGVIVQPSAEIDFAAYENKGGPINKITPYIGIWNDVTSSGNVYTNSGHLTNWYEFDWDVGVSIDFLNDWNFNVQYIEFLSPSDAFGTSKNIIPQITYNDAKLQKKYYPWLPFQLNPYVAGLIETSGKAGSGTSLGYYLEPGINPSYTFAATPMGKEYPITMTIPIKVGLGFNNFYGGRNASKNETFGYFSAGLTFGVPLPFMDRAVGGAWSANVGGAYYYYGEGTHFFNSGPLSGNKTSRSDGIGLIGLTCKF